MLSQRSLPGTADRCSLQWQPRLWSRFPLCTVSVLWLQQGSSSPGCSWLVLTCLGRGSRCLLDIVLQQWSLPGSSIQQNRLLGLKCLRSSCLLDTLLQWWSLLGSSIQQNRWFCLRCWSSSCLLDTVSVTRNLPGSSIRLHR